MQLQLDTLAASTSLSSDEIDRLTVVLHLQPLVAVVVTSDGTEERIMVLIPWVEATINIIRKQTIGNAEEKGLEARSRS